MSRIAGSCVVAEFSIHPIGEGTSVSKYVKAALAELKKGKRLRLQVTPMATVVEAAKLSDILAGVEAAHEAVFRMGAKRVDFTLRVDDRRDKPRHMEDKVGAVSQDSPRVGRETVGSAQGRTKNANYVGGSGRGNASHRTL